MFPIVIIWISVATPSIFQNFQLRTPTEITSERSKKHFSIPSFLFFREKTTKIRPFSSLFRSGFSAFGAFCEFSTRIKTQFADFRQAVSLKKTFLRGFSSLL